MVVWADDVSFRVARRDDTSKPRTDPRGKNPDDKFSNHVHGDECGSSPQR
jgi:hypothetical protein